MASPVRSPFGVKRPEGVMDPSSRELRENVASTGRPVPVSLHVNWTTLPTSGTSSLRIGLMGGDRDGLQEPAVEDVAAAAAGRSALARSC